LLKQKLLANSFSHVNFFILGNKLDDSFCHDAHAIPFMLITHPDKQTFMFPRQMVHMPTALGVSPKIGLRLLAWPHYLKGTLVLPSKQRKILA
jgi:hypothetical protein